jgi:hypothetical protein
MQQRKPFYPVRRHGKAVADLDHGNAASCDDGCSGCEVGNDQIRLQPQEDLVPHAQQRRQSLRIGNAGGCEDVAHGRRRCPGDLLGRDCRPAGRGEDLDAARGKHCCGLWLLDDSHQPKIRLPQPGGEPRQHHDVAHPSAKLPGQKNGFDRHVRTFDLTGGVAGNYLACRDRF